MASTAFTGAFFSAATITQKHPYSTARGGVVVKAMRVPQESSGFSVVETTPKRRDFVFSAATVMACTAVGKMAMAEEEPKRGTEEAKKKYTPVCVTMPTARICHK